MALDLKSVERSFLKLRKTLKTFPESPHTEEVHALRTETRRVEATVRALLFDQQRDGEHLLKALKPIRKAAGEVRDLDVLIGLTISLATPSATTEDPHLVDLLTQLGTRRTKAAAELYTVISEEQAQARHFLKQCSQWLERESDTAGAPTAQVAAQAIKLTGELEAWPRLTAANIHPYRLTVKELRYVLQLGEDEQPFIDSLTEVKDSIGTWHDWSELASLAKELLDPAAASKLLTQIRSRVRREFKNAVATAHAMQHNYLESISPRRGTRKPPQAQRTPTAMRAAVRLIS